MSRLPYAKYRDALVRYEKALARARAAEDEIVAILASCKPTTVKKEEWASDIHYAFDDLDSAHIHPDYPATLQYALGRIVELSERGA